jgi:tellurite resistance protein
MTQSLLIDVPPSPSPFKTRCAELGIETTPAEEITAKGVTVTTLHVATFGKIHATSEESERDAALKICEALGIQFEK